MKTKKKYLLLLVVLLAVATLVASTVTAGADIGVQTPLPEEVYCSDEPDHVGSWSQIVLRDMSKYCHCNRWIPTKGCIQTNKTVCKQVASGLWQCTGMLWDFPEGFTEIEEPPTPVPEQKVTVTGIAGPDEWLEVRSPDGEHYFYTLQAARDGRFALFNMEIGEFGVRIYNPAHDISVLIDGSKTHWEVDLHPDHGCRNCIRP